MGTAFIGRLDYPPMMFRDPCVKQLRTQRLQPRQHPRLVLTHEPAVADHVDSKDRC